MLIKMSNLLCLTGHMTDLLHGSAGGTELTDAQTKLGSTCAGPAVLIV